MMEHSAMSDVVKRYYDENAETEWERLVSDPYRRLEYVITMHFLEKYLPREGLILDAGGGPGRYTIELARRGYDLVLLDLSPKCLDVARREIDRAGVGVRVKKVVEGNIADLSGFEDESYDSVLCLGGALSHILDEKERDRAAGELVRVLREGAPIFVSVINLYGVYMVVLKRLTDELVNPSHREMFTHGVHRAKWHTPVSAKGFTDAKFFHPMEIRGLFEGHGVETLEMATCQGLSTQMVEETNSLYADGEKWEKWLEILINTCNDPCILGLGNHFLYIGKKAHSHDFE